MSAAASTKPYMMRAIYEWCVDNGYTPYLAVAVNGNTRVPMAHVRDGEIVLNINYTATKDLLIGNDAITFSARFGGVPNAIYVPVGAVRDAGHPDQDVTAGHRDDAGGLLVPGPRRAQLRGGGSGRNQ